MPAAVAARHGGAQHAAGGGDGVRQRRAGSGVPRGAIRGNDKERDKERDKGSDKEQGCLCAPEVGEDDEGDALERDAAAPALAQRRKGGPGATRK